MSPISDQAGGWGGGRVICGSGQQPKLWGSQAVTNIELPELTSRKLVMYCRYPLSKLLRKRRKQTYSKLAVNN